MAARRRFIVLLGVLGSSLLLAALLGCTAAPPAGPGAATPAAGSAATPPPGQSPAAAAPSPKAPAKPAGPAARTPADTIVIGLKATLFADSIDPGDGLGRGLVELIADPLVAVDGDRIVPRLATAWRQVRPDAMQFTLRPGVVFANGQPVTAEDVRYSIERLASPAGGYQTPLFRNWKAEVVDPQNVILVPPQVDPVIHTRVVAFHVVSEAVSSAATKEDLKNRPLPLGSGPYVVSEYQVKSRLVLTASPTAWRRPAFPRLDVRFLPEDAARTAALRAGDIDVADQVTPDMVAGLEREGFTVHRQPRNQIQSYFMNVNLPDSPYRDARVRESAARTIDRQQIVDTVFSGLYQPATQVALPGVLGYLPDYRPPAVDLERARQLLAEAGYPSGYTIPFRYISTVAGQADVSAVLEGQFRRVGVTLRLEPIEAAVWAAGIARNEVGPATLYFTVHRVPDADQTLSFFQTGASARSLNDPRFDDLFRESRRETDPARRERLLQEMHRILLDANQYIYLYANTDLLAAYPAIGGIRGGTSDAEPIHWEEMTKRP